MSSDESCHAQYTRGPILGRGAYKTVFRAIDRSKGIEVAWNEVRLEGDVNFDKLVAEITMLRSLRGGYFIGCYESWIDESAFNLIFISELMESGNLKSFIHEAKGVSIGVMKDYCSQILKGLLYIHTLNPPIIHRDIKLDNIFFHGPAGQVKIGDLGIATLIDPVKGQKPKTVCGTPEFMAPEFYTENYNEKVDIWAFGLCVLEMVTLEYPYEECANNYIKVFQVVTAGLKPRILVKIKDDTIVDFIGRCLEKDKDKRPSAEQLFPDPFLVRLAGDTSKFAEFRDPEEMEAILNRIGGTQEGWDKFIAEKSEKVTAFYSDPKNTEIQEGVKAKLAQLVVLKENNLKISSQLQEAGDPEIPPTEVPSTAPPVDTKIEDIKKLVASPAQPRPTTPPVIRNSPSKSIYNDGTDEEDVILDDDAESKHPKSPRENAPDADEIIDDIDLLGISSGNIRRSSDRRPSVPNPTPARGTSQEPVAPNTPLTLRTSLSGAGTIKFDNTDEDVLIDDEPMSSLKQKEAEISNLTSKNPPTKVSPRQVTSPNPIHSTQATQVVQPATTSPLPIPGQQDTKIEGSPDDNNSDIDNFLLKNLTHFQSSSLTKK